MKKIWFTTTITLFFLICSNGIQAQTTQTELNQVELMKQLLGSWKCDTGKGIPSIHEAKSFGTGLECFNIRIIKDSVIQEVKQLWGYNKENDKYFGAQMGKGMGLELYVMWFISNTKYKIVPYDDLSNPEKARLKMEGEFKSPDIFVETIMWDNETISTGTFTRVKE
ncbi:MAG: hypothetical protein A2Y71_08375 [Bacteroidetes bacterium RBG_13_42_15]|nr:MAG: hypothetical protein A2Y71_08375 [Bacteroidetes bacterium RBG_13_42_15]